MCHLSGKPVTPMNFHCGCACACPVVLTVEDGIRNLEDHKKILEDQLEVIDKNITALKTAKQS